MQIMSASYLRLSVATREQNLLKVLCGLIELTGLEVKGLVKH